MTANLVHDRLAYTAMMYIAVVGIWGFIRFFRKEQIDSSYWGALVIGELLILVQIGLGIYLWAAGFRPSRMDQIVGGVNTHIFYGIVVGLIIPSLFAMTRGRDTRSTLPVYGAGLLFLAALLVRTATTG
jgi:hypothetical protein